LLFDAGSSPGAERIVATSSDGWLGRQEGDDHMVIITDGRIVRNACWILATVVQRGSRPFVAEVLRLLDENSMSQRALARAIGMSSSHLSRVLRRVDYKTPSIDLMERVAAALGVSPEEFPEFREASVIAEVRVDPALRDALFEQLTSHGRKRPTKRAPESPVPRD
jgi:transcriptional regulator with XRE-family HTH domain